MVHGFMCLYMLEEFLKPLLEEEDLDNDILFQKRWNAPTFP
jgi:hypothetical protein